MKVDRMHSARSTEVNSAEYSVLVSETIFRKFEVHFSEKNELQKFQKKLGLVQLHTPRHPQPLMARTALPCVSVAKAHAGCTTRVASAGWLVQVVEARLRKSEVSFFETKLISYYFKIGLIHLHTPRDRSSPICTRCTLACTICI